MKLIQKISWWRYFCSRGYFASAANDNRWPWNSGYDEIMFGHKKG